MLIVGAGYGRVVGLRIEAASEATVRSALPFWWTHTDDPPEHVLDVGSPDLAPQAVRALELWVAEHARQVVFVHAAVVAVNDRALLLPGRSTAGKTTLTGALLAAGADYLSDEYAVLDAAGRVHPYPRALSVRTPDGRRAVPAADFGARTTRTPVPVVAVAVVQYAPDAVWLPRSLPTADAVLRLLENTVSAQSAPASALDAAVAALRDARAVEGVRDEAPDIVADLLELLADQGTM